MRPGKPSKKASSYTEFIQRVTSLSPDIIVVCDYRLARIVYINREMLTVLGVDTKTIKNKDPQYLIRAIVHPDDWHKWEKTLESVKHIGDREVAEDDYRMRSASGAWRWYHRRSMVFKRDTKGNVVQSISISQDITVKKEAEEKIADMKNLLESVIATSPLRISVMKSIRNEQGEITDFEYIMTNGSESYIPGKEVAGKRVGELYPEMVAPMFDRLVRTVGTGEPQTWEQLHRFPDGERWYHVSVVKLNDGFVATSLDITDRKNAEQELKETIRQLESFTYVASHDLQEPLRKIQTFASLLQDNKYDEAAVGRYLSKISESSERMSQLIQSLLDYSRAERAMAAFQPTDLNKVLEDVKTDYEIMIREKHASITSDVLPVIPAIPFQMRQLFSNLIGNSLKFSDKKPEIKISAKIISGEKMKKEAGMDVHTGARRFCEIKFTDNGIGFDNRYNEKLFRIFQRLHPEYKGTGIGLSIVDKIIRRHKGYIKAHGEKNKGATFWVYLPA